MTVDTSRVETSLEIRFRSIAHRYRMWRITDDQMKREVRAAIVEAKQEVIELLKDQKENA